MYIKHSKELRNQSISSMPLTLLMMAAVVFLTPEAGVSTEDYVLDTFGSNIEEKNLAIQLSSHEYPGQGVHLRSWNIRCTRWPVYDDQGNFIRNDYYLSGFIEDYHQEFSSVSLNWPGGIETMVYELYRDNEWHSGYVLISSSIPPAFPLFCTILLEKLSGQTEILYGTVNSFGDLDQEPRVNLTSPPYEGSFRVQEHDFGEQVVLKSISIDTGESGIVVGDMEIEIQLYGKETETSDWYQIGVYTFGPETEELAIDGDITVRKVKYGLLGTDGIKLSAPISDPTPDLLSVTLKIETLGGGGCIPPDAELLHPLSVGLLYVYSRVDGDGQTSWIVEREFIEKMTANSKDYYLVRELNYDNDGESRIGPYVRSTHDAVYLYNPPDDNIEWQAAPVGTTWTVSEGSSNKIIEVVAIEEVTVPYGTFCAYKYRTYMSENPDVPWYEWIVPGVGIVKEESYRTGSGQTAPLIMELTNIVREPVAAIVDVIADTITQQTKSIKCNVQLPQGLAAKDIKPESILLSWDGVSTSPSKTSVRKKQNMLVAVFPTLELRLQPRTEPYMLTLTGELTDGTLFEGHDNITVVSKHRK
jgi:hypothetical protein